MTIIETAVSDYFIAIIGWYEFCCYGIFMLQYTVAGIVKVSLDDGQANRYLVEYKLC